MNLDHHAVRLLADYGADWKATVGGAANRLRPSHRSNASAANQATENRRSTMSNTLRQTLTRALFGTLGMATCATLCLVGATAASAAETGTVRTQVVGYADLDLTNPKGQAALERRIRAAAHTVCDVGNFGSIERVIHLDEQRCLRTAIAGAHPQNGALADAR